MFIKQKLGKLENFRIGSRTIDLLPLQWYESNKKLLHRKTLEGREVVMKYLHESPELSQDDVVYEDESCLIVVDIQPCSCIVLHPRNMYEMAAVCYEIGNKNFPVFYEEEAILVPFEPALFHILLASGYDPAIESRKLLCPLKTPAVENPHGSSKLFSRIMNLPMVENS
ncbi:MAG: urease accessory protein UreE [Flavisolibacter sp.]